MRVHVVLSGLRMRLFVLSMYVFPIGWMCASAMFMPVCVDVMVMSSA